ncbi:MAG: ATP phosphoribosyltransferase, partial [Pirellulaceae bacterium]|nr:ATP phosphoribosyltransferase [Pirellulaceae bacterium]
GSDLVEESRQSLVTRLPLGVGKCRLAICVPEESSLHKPSDLHNIRIATSFPRCSENFLKRHEVEAHLVPITGSVEAMISLGVAEAIVDLVETGSTLVANRLRILETIGNYEAILVQNKDLGDSELANKVVRRLEGIVIAREYSLLEYNIPREKLAQAEELTPGFESPTVSALEDLNWCAVRVMVKRDELIELMEKLERVGATAVLETQIQNCRL